MEEAPLLFAEQSASSGDRNLDYSLSPTLSEGAHRILAGRRIAYLDMAEKCRTLAGQVKEAKNKKQLDDMAQEWERMASERVKYAAAAAKYAVAAGKPS